MGLFPVHIRAIFRNGKFEPQEPCGLPDNALVELTVESPSRIPPTVTDPVERAKVLADVVQCMQANPIPAGAPKFTRDQLHDRR